MDNKTKNELLSVIRALSVLPCAKPFSKPVDVVNLGIPDYLEIIKKPMDLGTIKKKLLDKLYKTQDEFIEDVYLIFENCRKYNIDPRSTIRILCEDLQTQFEIQWKMYKDRKSKDESLAEEKIPVKRAVESIEFKKVRKAKLKEEEKLIEVEKEKEKIREELEKKKEEIERKKAEKERLREERERLKEEKAREDRQKEIERKRIEAENKIKEKQKKKYEVEYEEVLNFDKLTGKDDFQSVVKIKMPVIAEKVEKVEPVVEEVKEKSKVESIDYMRAALLPLVDHQARSLLKVNLMNAMFTVSLLYK